MHNKFELYESSVQDPQSEVDFWLQISDELRKKEAHSMREDFCATFWNSATWVQQNPKNIAYAVDISKEALDFGRKKHISKLSEEQQKRLHILQKDVMQLPPMQVDLITVSNFSIFFLKQRHDLLAYCKKAYESLNSDGLLCVDVLGGTAAEEDDFEERQFLIQDSEEEVTYVWEQESFDPITRETLYAIHYKFNTGKKMKRAFTYDWRMWSIPELKDVMLEAGFKDVAVYWEEDDEDGEGSGVFSQHKSAVNCASWIAYVVGLK